MAAKSILILGGGVGGIVAANTLRRKLGKDHSIVLVDKKESFHFAPSFLWLMMGWRSPAEITRSLSILSKRGIKYLKGIVSKIDADNRIVIVDGEDYHYDYLILALGADLAPEVIPGLAEVGHHIYELSAAEKFRDALRYFSSGTLAVVVTRTPFKCPAAPYEATLLLDYKLRRSSIRDKVSIQLFTAEPQPMPLAGPAIGDMIKRMLSERNIDYHPNQKLTSVDIDRKELAFEKGERTKFDLLLAVPPHKAPSVVAESGLTDASGWVPVDGRTLRTKYDDFYAIGDVTSIKLPSGMTLPKAGVFAEGQAHVVANNIASEIKGVGERVEWDGKGACFIEAGFGRTGFATGEFFAEPMPKVKPRRPGRIWHWGKVLFEKYWLWRQF